MVGWPGTKQEQEVSFLVGERELCWIVTQPVQIYNILRSIRALPKRSWDNGIKFVCKKVKTQIYFFIPCTLFMTYWRSLIYSFACAKCSNKIIRNSSYEPFTAQGYSFWAEAQQLKIWSYTLHHLGTRSDSDASVLMTVSQAWRHCLFLKRFVL